MYTSSEIAGLWLTAVESVTGSLEFILQENVQDS